MTSLRDASVTVYGPQVLYDGAVELELPRGLSGGIVEWRTPKGVAVVTVVTKATFRLRPDVVDLVEEGGDPLVVADETVRKAGGVVLRPAELVPGKAQPEMLLVGSAFAPDELPVQHLVARLSVGKVTKAVEVFGERWWQPDETLGQPTPWLSFPLTYEHAAGGPATWNPIGVPVGTSGDELTRRRAPSLVMPGASPRSPSAPTPVACFAPVPASWPIRKERTDALRKLAVAQSLDAESELMAHQAAPTDQLLDVLVGDETVILENLCRGTPRLTFRLPGVAPRVLAPGLDPGAASVVARPDTIFIDTDAERLSLVWRSRHRIADADRARTVTVEWTRISQDPALAMAQEAIFAAEDGQTLVTKARPWLREDVAPDRTKRTQPEMELSPKPSSAAPPRPSPVRLASKPPPPGEVPRPAARPAAQVERGSSPRSGVRAAPEPVPIGLVFADARRIGDLQQHPHHRSLLAEARRAPPIAPSLAPAAEDERRSEIDAAFSTVLSKASPTPLDGLADAGVALGEGGPWLFVVEGELRLSLDEREELAAIAELAGALGQRDREIDALLALAAEAVASPAAPSRAFLVDLAYRIGRAWAARNAALPPDLPSSSARERLLERRAFTRRNVLGGLHVRAELASPRGSHLAAYLPDVAAPLVPPSFALPVRALVDVHPRQSDADPTAVSLRIVALGVVVRAR